LDKFKKIELPQQTKTRFYLSQQFENKKIPQQVQDLDMFLRTN